MIAGFRASNHPQQVALRGAVDAVDDRGTLPEFVESLEARFGKFTLDVAASEHNAKADRYYSLADDGLVQSWAGEHVWCNPPYSDIRSWVAKAWAEFENTRGIVMLLPANRPEQKWWQELVEPFRDRAGSPLTVEFLRGRLRFIRPNARVDSRGDRPPFGCCLLTWKAVK